MVKSFGITLAEHSAYLSTKRAPYVPTEPHAYPSRSTNLKREAINSYRTLLLSVCDMELSPAELARYEAHCNAVLDQLEIFDSNNTVNRYEEVYPGIIRDMAFALEAGGMMLAAKYYQQVFDISKFFAHLLAFILGENPDTLEAQIKRNCASLDLDYNNLAIGLCSMDKYLLPVVKLECFEHVSPHLDRIMTDMVKFPAQCIYNLGTEYLDLRDPSYSPAQRFTTFLTFQLSALTQHIFDNIIRDYESDSVRTCMLVSKTTSTLIFQGNKVEIRPSYDVSLGNIKLLLEPCLVQTGTYIKSYIRGCM